MPSSAHPRGWAVLLATVLALFCALAGTGAGAGFGEEAVPPYGRTAAAAPGPAGAAGSAGGAAPSAVPGAPAASDAGERGPRCGPGPAAPDRAPAVPARAGTHLDHALAVWARPALPGSAAPRRAPGPPCGVRGPDRPAPGPVELSVMRV
ncbi:hypothetical protein ACFV7Q_24690 [Streptomyces sp. NPDC059851]|uniref:hypothetical protein n=1 Tax=Streptomyces sp. NPDC059851 TaxID=3346971 RepID=UPI003663CB42